MAVEQGVLSGQTVAVLGYGSQGRAQALNLRDSGVDVVVGLRNGSGSAARAAADGLTALPVADAVQRAAVVAMLMPDPAQPVLFADVVQPHLRPGAALLFSHGFNVRYGTIQPPPGVDVLLVAPKAPGAMVRETYQRGQGVPCLLAVHNDATGRARAVATDYAGAIGGAREGLLWTTFAEETETDLFGEQAVLCGGVTALVKAAFETLTNAGYQPEVAYYECLHELKLIVDLLYRGGVAEMRRTVSDTARYGDVSRGPRVVDRHVREAMAAILSEVRDGTFAREWLAEDAAGRPRLRELVARDDAHLLEQTGRKLRACMPWLNGGKP